MTRVAHSPATLLLLLKTEVVELEALHAAGRGGMPVVHSKLERIQRYINDLQAYQQEQSICEHPELVPLWEEPYATYCRCKNPFCGVVIREDKQ